MSIQIDGSIDSLTAFVAAKANSFANEAVKADIHNNLVDGKRFYFRDYTAVDDIVTDVLVGDHCDDDLRLPYRTSIFIIPCITTTDRAVVIAKQSGSGVELTGFNWANNNWLFNRITVKVRQYDSRPGISYAVTKNLGAHKPQQIASWLVKMFVFGMNELKKNDTSQPLNVLCQASRPRSSTVPVMPNVAPTHSQTTVTINTQPHSGVMPTETGIRRTGTPKRQHDRRGHWRVYKRSGKKVWIPAMKVGHRILGTVDHDYRVI